MAVEGVAGQLQLIFDEYAKKLDIKTDDIMEETATETRDYLRQNSPKRSGDYAKSWAVKKDKKSHMYIVHNKDHYRLTHLLEYGHIVKNRYGTYGRTNADPHIKRAEENGVHLLFDKLEKQL